MSSEQNYNVNFGIREAKVQLVYLVKYQKGEAVETFIWHVGPEGAKLIVWDVRSEQLVIGTE